jgi:hypothetical protein
MDGAWISLGHCKCDKWCPRWMRVMFSTNAESFSRRWRSNSVSMSFRVWSCYTPWGRLRWLEVLLQLILNLGTRWGWVVSITPRPRFTPGERTPDTHWTGDWMGPRAGLDAEARRKILCLCRGPNPGRPVRSQTRNWLSYPGSQSKVLKIIYMHSVHTHCNPSE